MKKITEYLFSLETRIYMGPGEAYESPLEAGKFLTSGNGTEKPVIPPKAGYERVFNDDWEYIEDNTGKKQYAKEDGIESTIEYLGPVKDTYSLIEYKAYHKWSDTEQSWIPNEEKINDVITVLKSHIEADRDTALQQSVELKIDGSSFIFQADEYSQNLLLKTISIYNITGAAPDDFTWWDINNIKHPFTLNMLKQLALTIGVRNKPLYQKGRDDKDNLNNLTINKLIELL